jgi:hypothetical protein
MSFKIIVTYPDGSIDPRVFDDPSNCKCPTSRFLRDVIKAEQFKTIIVENL